MFSSPICTSGCLKDLHLIELAMGTCTALRTSKHRRYRFTLEPERTYAHTTRSQDSPTVNLSGLISRYEPLVLASLQTDTSFGLSDLTMLHLVKKSTVEALQAAG
ncbi:unnamed protein product [Protopolystoma xenopodis]|uniref:Uncharacterized protein n=1 Tax=Protopolystoma xenopodis TaxID=117903 RepID=A0A448WG79_9PLAT|nr:unnamed protein product [Protopolystoma xenopodis]